MIRDRLVCGINDEKIQQRLLLEPKLTLTKATQLAQASELAKQDAAEINKAPRDPAQVSGVAVTNKPVHKLSITTMSSDRECYRCKGTFQVSI